MKRSIWMIREVGTGSFCTSSKGDFGSFEDAALFHQKENAETSIRKIRRGVNERGYFFLAKVGYVYISEEAIEKWYSFRHEIPRPKHLKAAKKWDFEVVECVLTPVTPQDTAKELA